MPGWLDIANGWSAIPLQVAGFGFAIWQIMKARGAAEEAKVAADTAAHRIGSNLLLAVLPQLTQVESSLEWAVSRNDRVAAIHYLGSWRWQAGQMRGLLGQDFDETDDLLVEIQTSIAAAADAKLILQDPTADVRKRCRGVQKAISAVTGSIGELSARRSVEDVSAK